MRGQGLIIGVAQSLMLVNIDQVPQTVASGLRKKPYMVIRQGC